MATATAAERKEFKEEIGARPPAEVVSWLNFLVYGPPGVGKTTLAGTAEDHPDTSPTLVIDVEGGVVTLRKRKNIDVVSVRSIKEIVDLHNKLHGSSDCGGYKTVVLDSITELQKLDMNTIMKEVVNARPDLDQDVPSQREWGKSGERMRRIIRAFRDLPVNTIMTALAVENRDNSNALTYAPSLPGKLRQEVPGFLDVVGYMTSVIEEGVVIRKLQVAGTQRVVAKDRTDSLGGLVINPTIPDMWETIQA